ncbi:MAG TPA: glycosyltransferase [Polyangiaceae bacterium]|nr:glycosyltransferase [Polyangiaceae bacterium]
MSEGAPTETVPQRADVWFHGLGGATLRAPADEADNARLVAFPRDVVIYQLCDSDSMSFQKLLPPLREKARLFLRNHWPTDKHGVPSELVSRLGYLPPMIRPITPHPGVRLTDRRGGAIFYGTPTGKLYFPEGRERLIKLLRGSGLPFEGGLSPDPQCPREPPPGLTVPRIQPKDHARRLADAKICLAPWGNHKLTYRLFEGLAARCLVITQPFDDIDFLHGGLRAGVHYVESDARHDTLVERVGWYLDHLDEAQRIADAGYLHFCRYLAPRGKLVSEYLFDASVSSWGELYRPATGHNPAAALRAATARLFPNWF